MFDTVTYSAPGNLMLMGEHAVLHNSTCLAYAVNQRIQVTVRAIKKNEIIIISDIGHYTISITDLSQLPIQSMPENFRFILATIKKSDFKYGMECTVQSDFSSTIGLSSSAAITVATVASLRKIQNQDTDLHNDQVLKAMFNTAHDIVCQVQNNQGSGYDIATSIWGGLIEYQPYPFNIKKIIVETLPISVIYSGYKTKTADAIKIVNHQENIFKNEYSQIYKLINDLVHRAGRSIRNSDWQTLGHLFNMNQGLLDAIGVNDSTLSEIIYWARNNGAIGSKISGSGLGDCIIALGNIPHYPANKRGIVSFNLQISNQGLRSE